MSDAALTDSTTPRLAYWRTFAPFSGSSTNTTSPSCSCAKCVMPIVATSPSARTHSCSFEYWRLSGTVLTSFPSFCTSGSLRSPPAVSSLRSSTVKRCLHYRSGNVLSANADGQGRSDLRKRRRHAGQRAGLLDLAPGREQAVPHRGRVGVGHEHLEAILAGVAGTRQGRASPGHAPLRDAERRERADVGVSLGREDLHRARALDRDERGPERAIVERDVLAQVRENMGTVLRDVRAVDDHHVFGLADPVDDDVVHARAPLVRQQPVPRLAHREPGDVARNEAIQGLARPAPSEEELAHVREIEEARAPAHGTMLGDDPLVLDRHFVTREGHHLRAKLGVLVVERSPAHGRRCCRHQAASPAAARARSSISRYVSNERRRRASSAETQRTSSYS